MASRRTSKALHEFTKNFNSKYGPLPPLAINYILLKQEIESADSERRRMADLDSRIYGEWTAPVKSKNLTQNKTKLIQLETQLKTQRHIYRSIEHMDEVLYLLFPDCYAERPKSPIIAAEPAPVIEAPVAAPPPKPSNDAWDMY
jgi:hypothetical protein